VGSIWKHACTQKDFSVFKECCAKDWAKVSSMLNKIVLVFSERNGTGEELIVSIQPLLGEFANCILFSTALGNIL
jgi:hypothetical protein